MYTTFINASRLWLYSKGWEKTLEMGYYNNYWR